jgi:hypothetical protein
MRSLREAAPYALRLPLRLPEGYAFHQAMLTPNYRTLIAYTNGQDSLLLLQLPVGAQPAPDGERPVRAIVELLTEDSVVPVTLSVGPAVWVGDRALMWEDKGMNLVLGGTNLRREEAALLAESLVAAREED